MAQKLRRQLKRRESDYVTKNKEQRLVDATICITNRLRSAARLGASDTLSNISQWMSFLAGVDSYASAGRQCRL
jgi:hypothetical protein